MAVQMISPTRLIRGGVVWRGTALGKARLTVHVRQSENRGRTMLQGCC